MAKWGTNTSHSPGICQRLFNFILNTLACSFKRETMPNPSVSSEIPIESSSRNGFNPEVLVEYRHVDPIEWFNDRTRYNILREPRKKSPSVYKVSSVEKEKKNLAAEAANPDTTKPTQPPRQQPRWHMLQSVSSNINKKAEDFIVRKKENMTRSYSYEPKKF